MRPIIGINADIKELATNQAGRQFAIQLKWQYVEAVRRAGGVPLILPPGAPEDIPSLLARLDGIILSGGGDMRVEDLHPAADLMDSRREAFDLALARTLFERKLPVLGICLGMQELAVAAGGGLHQHLPDAGIVDLLDHGQEGDALHDVAVTPGTRLGAILGTKRMRVVSHHHQAVRAIPTRFRQAAAAPDGVIEAMELPGEHFLVAVQWHPERAPDAPETAALFRALVEAAQAPR